MRAVISTQKKRSVTPRAIELSGDLARAVAQYFTDIARGVSHTHAMRVPAIRLHIDSGFKTYYGARDVLESAVNAIRVKAMQVLQ